MKLKLTGALVALLVILAAPPASADPVENSPLAAGEQATATVSTAGDEVVYAIDATARHSAGLVVESTSWTAVEAADRCGAIWFQAPGEATPVEELELTDGPASVEIPIAQSGQALVIVRGCPGATGSATLHWNDVLPSFYAVTPTHIVGDGRVGSTLTVTPPQWSEDGVETTYQWRAGNDVLSGATSDRLPVTDALRGTVVSLIAYGSRPDFSSTYSPSDNDVVVPKVSATIHAAAEVVGYRTVRVAIDVEPASELPSGYRVRLEDQDGPTSNPWSLALVDGHADKVVSSLSGGRHRFTASIEGTTRLEGATSTAAVTVPDRLAPAVSVTGRSERVGQAELTIGVTAPGESRLGGTVTVKDGTRTLRKGLKVVDGRVTWTGTKLRTGQHTFTVVYAGTAQVTSGTATTSLRVKPKDAPSLKPTGSSPAPGKIKIAVRVSAPGATPTGTVTITLGRKKLGKVTLAGGWASLTAKASGTHTYKVTYSGDSQTAGGSKSVKATALPLKHFANCTALREVYPHGVGRTGAVDHVSGSSDPVTNFYRSNALYQLNTGSDRDDDKIACEQH